MSVTNNLALAAILALGLVGCGDGWTNTKTVTNSDGTTTIVKETVQADGRISSDANGGASGRVKSVFSLFGAAEWPASTPSYAPPYPSGEVISVASAKTDLPGLAPAEATSITFTTSDSPETVTSFYKSRSGNLAIVIDTGSSAASTFKAGQDATRGVEVTATRKSGRTAVSLGYVTPA